MVFITNLLQFFAYRADFWFINYFQSKADVGIYAQASKFAQLLWLIPGILAGLIIPALRNETQKIQKPEFLSICRLVFFFHLVIATLLILFSFLLYRYFLPVEFFNGFESLLLMIPGYILFTISIIMATWFSANRLLRINFTGTLICLLAVIVTDWALIPIMSYRGAAIANLVSYSVTTLFFILVSMSYLNAGWKDIFIIRQTDFRLFIKKFISPGINKKA
jgi:O-antigen/teichoic acid export membrane protein